MCAWVLVPKIVRRCDARRDGHSFRILMVANVTATTVGFRVAGWSQRLTTSSGGMTDLPATIGVCTQCSRQNLKTFFVVRRREVWCVSCKGLVNFEQVTSCSFIDSNPLLFSSLPNFNYNTHHLFVNRECRGTITIPTRRSRD